ncbi:toxin VasX [Marinobacter sp. MMG032]|uniref:Toxin VasX n=1 Tax=Marinobacter sp. MMG032 TaxID=3158548 RepID=A0AAU7MI60_9GAMM
MGSANSSAFLQGADDIDSAAQMCPLPLKTVALYPVRWAISQEEVALPSNFRAPNVSLDKAFYCLRTLKAGWLYLYSELYGTLHEYRVGKDGVISEVQAGVNSVLLPDADAESALPCIHHPEAGKVFLKFVQHRWTVRLQELARTDAEVRSEYMQAFNLDGLFARGYGENIAETETVNQFVEEYRAEQSEFEWSLTDFTAGLSEQDFQGQSKKATEFSYYVALDDEIGITSELGQLHALYVNLITNHAEENVYPYSTAKLVDALIELEASKKTNADDQEDVRNELKERIRYGDKEAFVAQYHKKIEEYDRERGRVFEDWKRWIDSDLLARKLEFNDICMATGFEAVEKELADILDGYVSAEKGREDANKWMETEDGEAGIVGDTLKAVLFLVSSINKVTEKLKDLPGFDYGRLKIVDSMYDLPAFVSVTTATDTLLLEFATPAAQMGEWARNRQTRPQWKKWIKNVSRRYQIQVHEHSMSLDRATDLLFKAHQDALTASSGISLSGATLSPVAAGMMEIDIRNRLKRSFIDAFHLTPDFKDNPFGWLHTRLDPVVESIKENRGNFIGAVTFFHAVNMVALMSSLKETQKDVMLGDRSAIDKWLPFVDNLWSLAEGVVNFSGLLIQSEYIKILSERFSATGSRVSVAVNGLRGLKVLSGFARFIARGAVKLLPFVGTMLAIGLEGRTAWRAWHTGHNTALGLAVVQVGLTAGIGYLTFLALAGAFAGTGIGAGVAVVGAVLVVLTVAITAVQMYVARSRIEDFLSTSFWGDARTLRYWGDQIRPSNDELLDTSKSIVLPDKGLEVRQYFEVELDAFYYLLFSPIVRITENMSKHPAITQQGEYKVLSEYTSFVVYFPGFDPSSSAASVRLFEAERNILFKDDFEEITELFNRRKEEDFSGSGATNKFTHYNHNNREQLELLIEYVKDGRNVTGDDGLRVILDGDNVEELGVDERLTFEL